MAKRSKSLITLIAIPLITAIIAIAALQIVGPSRIWQRFGLEDLGSVNFDTLERRLTPNDALACPPGFCKARADIETPDFGMPVEKLRTAFRDVVSTEDRVEIVEADETGFTDRYIQRSWVLGFPDTIVVRYIERPENHSTLAIYSRSRFGRSDFGVNRDRLERWLSKLRSRVAE